MVNCFVYLPPTQDLCILFLICYKILLFVSQVQFRTFKAHTLNPLYRVHLNFFLPLVDSSSRRKMSIRFYILQDNLQWKLRAELLWLLLFTFLFTLPAFLLCIICTSDFTNKINSIQSWNNSEIYLANVKIPIHFFIFFSQGSHMYGDPFTFYLPSFLCAQL